MPQTATSGLEHYKRRISVFSPEGEVLFRFGFERTGNGQFKELSDVEVDADGFAWVGDAENNRVQIFNPEGEYVGQFGEEGTGEGQFQTRSWIRLALAANGNVWITDSGNHRVERWKAPAFETTTYIPAYSSTFGGKGSGGGEFEYVGDVEVAPDGTLWAVDIGNDRLQHFSTSGEYLGSSVKVESPDAVAIDYQGDIYVSANYVKKLNSEGELVETLASYGTGEGQVRFAVGLDTDAEDNLWVADSENDRLDKFNPEGEFVESIDLGSLSRPWGVSVAPDGNIWAAEHYKRRISVFSPEGEVLFRFGSSGTGNGQLKELSDVEVDADGFAWVGDAENNRVQIFNPEGEYVGQFGEEGTGEGQFQTRSWIRLALAANGNVWITDSGNHRVERWIYGASPTVTSKPPPEVSESAATLNATVNPEGLSTSYQFEYTTAEDFEASGYANATAAPASPQGIGSGTKDIAVSEPVEGLEEGTTYHFRIVAENSVGTSQGKDMTFLASSEVPETTITEGAYSATARTATAFLLEASLNSVRPSNADWTAKRGKVALRIRDT